MTKYQKYKLIILIVFGIILLFILYGYSLNGKYIMQEELPWKILNTRTGEWK